MEIGIELGIFFLLNNGDLDYLAFEMGISFTLARWPFVTWIRDCIYSAPTFSTPGLSISKILIK